MSDRFSQEDAVWVHRLVADWQVLADLSASDLLLWLPIAESRFVVAAHCRPATGQTVHIDDLIGRHQPTARAETLVEALETGTIVGPLDTRWTGSYAVAERLIPVRHNGRTIAVLAMQTNLGAAHAPTSEQLWKSQAAEILCDMIVAGTFPCEESPGLRRGSPRVVDGVLRLDADGVVLHASPNAISAFSRLGVCSPLVNSVLAECVTNALEDYTQVDETLAVVLMGRASWRTEVEARGQHLSLRAIPLTDGAERLGAVVLVRDITEVRDRERELMTKDATIREIHHRVKNNLQTVSALLRLQARRSDNSEVRQALGEAERRVTMIAMVHEALSHTIDTRVSFDEVVGRIVRLAAAVATSDHTVTTRIEGSFGQVDGDAASALAVVLSELVSNAVEHAFADRDGEILVTAARDEEQLEIHVLDDGAGISPGASGSGLGTRIVQTLVRGELAGSIEWRARSTGGTDVKIRAHWLGAHGRRQARAQAGS